VNCDFISVHCCFYFKRSRVSVRVFLLEVNKRMKKRERGKNILRGLSSNYVDGVGEGVYASYVLVHVDSHGDGLRSASLKYSA
jgi:hypothetical protein